MTSSGCDRAKAKDLGEIVQGRQIDMAFFRTYRKFCLLSGLNVPRGGVIHIGGHSGEDLPFYLCYGFRRILTIEPLPEIFERLEHRSRVLAESAQVAGLLFNNDIAPEIKCVNCAILEAAGRVPFYATAITLWSSTKPLQKHEWATHMAQGPWYKRVIRQLWLTNSLRSRQIEVEAKTLDGVIASLETSWSNADYHYLRMNIQGGELRALRGAKDILRRLKVVDFDQTIAPRYGGTGAADISEYDAVLNPLGFALVSSTGGPINVRRVYARDPSF